MDTNVILLAVITIPGIHSIIKVAVLFFNIEFSNAKICINKDVPIGTKDMMDG
jgi:hypothetical protein